VLIPLCSQFPFQGDPRGYYCVYHQRRTATGVVDGCCHEACWWSPVHPGRSQEERTYPRKVSSARIHKVSTIHHLKLVEGNYCLETLKATGPVKLVLVMAEELAMREYIKKQKVMATTETK
jgi:hypothetical protein